MTKRARSRGGAGEACRSGSAALPALRAACTNAHLRCCTPLLPGGRRRPGRGCRIGRRKGAATCRSVGGWACEAGAPRGACGAARLRSVPSATPAEARREPGPELAVYAFPAGPLPRGPCCTRRSATKPGRTHDMVPAPAPAALVIIVSTTPSRSMKIQAPASEQGWVPRE